MFPIRITQNWRKPKARRTEQRRPCSYHRGLEPSSVFPVAALVCRGTWLVELVAKLDLRPSFLFLGAKAGVRYGMLLQNSSRERGCCPGRYWLRFTMYRLGGDRR